MKAYLLTGNAPWQRLEAVGIIGTSDYGHDYTIVRHLHPGGGTVTVPTDWLYPATPVNDQLAAALQRVDDTIRDLATKRGTDILAKLERRRVAPLVDEEGVSMQTMYGGENR